MKETKKPNVKKKKHKRSKLAVCLCGVLCVCVFTVGVVGIYIFGSIIAFANGDTAINLDEYKENQNQTSFVYAYDENGKEVEIARLHGEENRIWVDIDDMPKCLLDACVALEDKRFKDHNGVDWIRTVKCVTSFKFDQGGSTLTQQLIKNITQNKEVTLVRKFKEIMQALNLEKKYDKDVILEFYLNTVYLGSGCYGVETAAEKYFGKEVSELNLAESAVILSITNAPTKYNPLLNPEKNRDRQIYCLKEMLEQGIINQAEYDATVATELIFTNSDAYVPDVDESKKTDEDKPKEEEEKQSYYVDYVIQRVIEDLMDEYGYSKQQATDQIYYGGLRIYSAVDMNVQKEMEDVYENRKSFPKETNTKDHPAAQSAMTVMDYSGRVVGIVGGADKKVGKRVLNRAANSYRQPGSTIKPLSTYAPGIELNQLTWSTLTLDKAIPVKGKMWPHNVDGTLGSGNYVSTQYAIKVSLNTVPARIISQTLGLDTSYEYLKEHFKLSRLDDTEDKQLAPLATGALHNGVSTVEMASAYAAFGNGGMYYEPYCYYKVTNSQGTQVLLDNTSNIGIRVLNEDTADVMCELLQTVDTATYGSGKNLDKFQVFAKTGTTTNDTNRWFCAGTPYYVCSIWYGYDIPKELDVSKNPTGKIFIEIFNRIHAGLDEKTFPKSDLTIKKSFCTVSGKLAGSNCTSTAYGWYKLSNMPSTCTSCTYAPINVDQVVGGVAQGISDAIDSILGG